MKPTKPLQAQALIKLLGVCTGHLTPKKGQWCCVTVDSAVRGHPGDCPGRLYPPRPAASIWCQDGGLSSEARAAMYMVSGALASLGLRNDYSEVIPGPPRSVE